MNKLKENRTLLFVILYYIYSGVYFVIHMIDAKNPFMTSTLDCVLVMIGIFLCFAGLFRSSESRRFLIKGLKCFAVCDIFSLFLQYLYGKEVSLFFIWMNIILKVFIAIVLIRRILDYLADIYWKNDSKNGSMYLKIRKFRLGIFYLISPVIINYIYMSDRNNSLPNYKLTLGYIFLCFFIGLIQFNRFLIESISDYSKRKRYEEEPYARKWFFYWEWDRYNPISMIDRVLSAFAEILFGDKKQQNIIVSVSVVLMLLTAICNGVYVGGKHDEPYIIDYPKVEDGSMQIYGYSKNNMAPVNSKMHKTKYGIVTDGVDTGLKYPIRPYFKNGLANDGLGHLIDYHGNVVLTLPKIARSRISAKTKFFRDVFPHERERMYFSYHSGKTENGVAEIDLHGLMSDKGTAVFYSEVLDSYGMCNKDGEIIVKPDRLDFRTMGMESDKICIFSHYKDKKIYNYDGKVIAEKVLDSDNGGIDFIENLYDLDCIIYCYDKTEAENFGEKEHDYLRVIDYEGNIIADNIIYFQEIDTEENKYLLTMEDNRQCILTGSEGKPVVIEKEK